MLEALAIPRLRTGLLLPGASLVFVAWVVLALGSGHGSAGEFTAMWVAMAFAMMVPTVTRPMMKAAEGSPRRAWTFLSAFVLVWIAVGPVAYVAMNAIVWTPFWIALAWIAAGLYQVTPQMHRLLRSCGSVGYDGSPWRYGMRQGLRCVASCAPVMLAAMVTAMAVPVLIAPALMMLGLTVLLCWEKQPSATRQALTAVGMTMIVLAVLGVMVLGGAGAAHLH